MMNQIPPIPDYHYVMEYPRMYVTITYPPRGCPVYLPGANPWFCFLEVSETDPPPESLQRLYQAARDESDETAGEKLRTEYERRGLFYSGHWEDGLLVQKSSEASPDHPYFRKMLQDLEVVLQKKPKSLVELARLLDYHYGAKQLYHITKANAVEVARRMRPESPNRLDYLPDHGLLIGTNPNRKSSEATRKAFEEIRQVAMSRRHLVRASNFILPYSTQAEKLMEFLQLDFPLKNIAEKFRENYNVVQEWHQKMTQNANQHRILMRAVQTITGMSHFYAQDLDYCVAALSEAANDLGLPLAEEEALGLVKPLQRALETLSQPKEKQV